MVIPECEDYVLELGLARGLLPLKFLVDSAGRIVEFWDPKGDTAELEIMTREIDSVSRTYRCRNQ
jgi:hypothetical protein